MGPDAGTAIINGVALGFANAVPEGNIGLVAASGTGLQEVTSLIARQGGGVSQAVGVGGRDLSEAVGGIMMMESLMALQEDPDTQVLVLISKPPAPDVAEKVLDLVRASDKPTVVCFLGGDPSAVEAAGAVPATTLEEAALLAGRLAAGGQQPVGQVIAEIKRGLERRDEELKEPDMFKVLLHNDHYTTMEFVVEVLVYVFQKSGEEATQIMLNAANR